jgi:hypothetical protein
MQSLSKTQMVNLWWNLKLLAKVASTFSEVSWPGVDSSTELIFIFDGFARLLPNFYEGTKCNINNLVVPICYLSHI